MKEQIWPPSGSARLPFFLCQTHNSLISNSFIAMKTKRKPQTWNFKIEK